MEPHICGFIGTLYFLKIGVHHGSSHDYPRILGSVPPTWCFDSILVGFQVRIHPISERFVLWNSQHPAMARWSPCHWLSIMGDELQFGPRHGTTWGHRTYAAHEQDYQMLPQTCRPFSTISIYIYNIDLELLFMIFVPHFAAMLSESSFAAIKRDESSMPHVSFRGKYNQQSLVNKNIQHANGFPRSTLCRSLQHWTFLSQVQMLLTLPCWCGSSDLCHLVTHWLIWWGLLQFSYWLVWFVANFLAGFGHADNQFIVGHIWTYWV